MKRITITTSKLLEFASRGISKFNINPVTSHQHTNTNSKQSSRVTKILVLLNWFLLCQSHSALVTDVSRFLDIGWSGVPGSDPRVQAKCKKEKRKEKRRKKENHRPQGLGDRSGNVEMSTTSNTGNKRKEGKETAGICWKMVRK